MFQYEGKRVVGPNGERGTIRNGRLVIDETQVPPFAGHGKQLGLGEGGYPPALADLQHPPGAALGIPLSGEHLPIDAKIPGAAGHGLQSVRPNRGTMLPDPTLLGRGATPFADPRAQLLGSPADESMALGRLADMLSSGVQARPLIANLHGRAAGGWNVAPGLPPKRMASKLGAAPSFGGAGGLMHPVAARVAGQAGPARPGTATRSRSAPPNTRNTPSTQRPNRAAPRVLQEAEQSGRGVGYLPATSIPKAVLDDKEFQAGMTHLARKYGLAEDDLYRVMAYETAHSFSPSQRNKAGSSGTGLIQFMTDAGDWAPSKGYTRDSLSKMSRVDQLKVVDEYFHDNRLHKIDYPNIDDLYLTIYKPKARGKPNYLHAKRGSREYDQNKSFDRNGDGEIRGSEISYKIRRENIPGVGMYKAPRPPKQSMAPNSLRHARNLDEMMRAVMKTRK